MLPENWNVRKVKTLSKNIVAEATPNTNNPVYWDGDIPWMSSGEINNRFIYRTERTITHDGYDNASTKLIPPNSILIALAGQGQTRGRVAINRIELCTNQSLASIISNDKIEPLYLFYYFESQYEELRKLSAGDGGRGGLNLKIIKNVNVIVPIKLEQSKVAAILFTWDRAIELKEKLLKQKKLQKKGLMERLLTGKVRLPGFNDEWKKKRIKELLVLSERPIQLHDDMQYEQITIRRNYGGVESRGSSFGRKILVTSQFLVWQNDFVISRRQIAHGACGVVPLELDGAIVSNEYDVFTACADLDVHFFSYLMQLPIFKYKFYVYSNGVHIEKMIFHTYAWLKVEIKLPDYEEQVRIREIIDKRQMESDLLNQEITQLKLQKKGLMQLLLTGKVRVPGGGV
jgi:type I restriction enzyme, S subunit